METEKEQKIIEQCKRGNFDEFEKLYNAYFGKIYRFIYYRTRHKEIAQDLCSQIFIKVLENIKSFDFNKGFFSAWIYCIARNKLIDYYRTKKNEVNIFDTWGLYSAENLDRDLDAREKLKEVIRYTKNMTKEQREIIVMRVWDELSYKEISEITGKSEVNCKMIFSRTIRKLREEISLPLFFILYL